MENFTETDMAGVEHDMVGVENDMAGVENDMPGAENVMTGAEADLGAVEDTTVASEDVIGGTENCTDGTENTIDEGNNSMAGASENVENQQQGKNEEVGVKSSEKKWPGWPGNNVFRLLVPSHKVGGIIGRKGEFIKKTCEESKARIKVLDAHARAPERAVLFRT